MQIIRHYHNAPTPFKGSVIALGNFDGVHRGHRTVIETARSYAQAGQRPCTVMTFEPHPVTVLKPEIRHMRITSFASKMRQIRALDADAVFALYFTTSLAQMPAERFIDEILVKHLQVTHIVTGHDFIFGHQRSGNASLLKEKAASAGFNYTQIAPVKHEGTVCSSSQIRQFLREGKVRQASDMLGYSYHLTGKVRHGQALGRTLGFPTANLLFHGLLRPAFGVYAVQVTIEGATTPYKAIANLGNKPTLNQPCELLEVHIFDFNDNIYGKRLTVELLDFIRPEKKFDSLALLKEQIQADCTVARMLLQHLEK